jgi:hypothetical protein
VRPPSTNAMKSYRDVVAVRTSPRLPTGETEPLGTRVTARETEINNSVQEDPGLPLWSLDTKSPSFGRFCLDRFLSVLSGMHLPYAIFFLLVWKWDLPFPSPKFVWNRYPASLSCKFVWKSVSSLPECSKMLYRSAESPQTHENAFYMF